MDKNLNYNYHNIINTKTLPSICVTCVLSCLKFKIELKIAMKTWDILKVTYMYLIALLHISNDDAAYLFEISRNSKYFETRTKHLICGITEGGYV